MTPLAERLTSLTRDLMLIPSTDSRPDERRRAVQFVLNHLQGIDSLEIKRYESQGYESLVVTPKGCDHPDVLLCGHLDVVEHASLDAYASTVRDGQIHGPGSGDMKGAVAILIELFLRVIRRHPSASLGLAITTDEEIGGTNGLHYLVESEGLRCGIAIIPDGGALTNVTIAEKGIIHGRLCAVGESGHAARPWLACNPLTTLMDALTALRHHFTEQIPPATASAEHWYPTCSVTQIATPNQSINRIPSEACATLDIRFPPPHTASSMVAFIEELVRKHDPKHSLTFNTIITAEATTLDPDPVFLAITERLTHTPVTKVRASGGSDARFLNAHGIPVILSRPTVGNLHGHDEWIDIASMETYYHICEAYLSDRLALAL